MSAAQAWPIPGRGATYAPSWLGQGCTYTALGLPTRAEPRRMRHTLRTARAPQGAPTTTAVGALGR
eukprot:7084161-Pyramimonas_sp.AAC.1